MEIHNNLIFASPALSNQLTAVIIIVPIIIYAIPTEVLLLIRRMIGVVLCLRCKHEIGSADAVWRQVNNYMLYCITYSWSLKTYKESSLLINLCNHLSLRTLKFVENHTCPKNPQVNLGIGSISNVGVFSFSSCFSYLHRKSPSIHVTCYVSIDRLINKC